VASLLLLTGLVWYANSPRACADSRDKEVSLVMDLKENNPNVIEVLLLVAYRITRGLRGKVADS
jgi:hypothetical protein